MKKKRIKNNVHLVSNINIIDTYEYRLEMSEKLQDFFELRQLYNAAIREVRSKLETLDEEFHVRYNHNPIHHIECRLKTPQSIFEKLKRKGHEISVESIRKNLTDVAGIRVICNYIEDIYTIAELLLRQDDITLIRKRDYIANPKENGYRSLHLVIQIPIFLSDRKELVPVEVQIRTIAMDCWASLEHQLMYKSAKALPGYLRAQLKECAEAMNNIDLKMQSIFKQL
ncbi:MAG TPA: GTP pyrophosphokinase family protein [Clostridiaceae bacterium]|nr:GTP pyrophosphokinase family protein [Clostridiaceae bacterium]